MNGVWWRQWAGDLCVVRQAQSLSLLSQPSEQRLHCFLQGGFVLRRPLLASDVPAGHINTD